MDGYLNGGLTLLRLLGLILKVIFDLLYVLLHDSDNMLILFGKLNIISIYPLSIFQMQVVSIFRVQEVIRGPELRY